MSVEALSWALNLAPVPVDRGGKPNSACAFVLVGLANHAGPDGIAAFPSASTLVRYTRLSERTVRTALDRLEEAGLITPCAPEIVAARIRRADRRPQGWDLDLTRVRTDLDDDDVSALGRQYPGLRDRIAAARADEPRHQDDCQAQDQAVIPVDDSQSGVQPLHPAPKVPVDDRRDGVQRLHPVQGTGCNQRTNGVQPAQSRGAAVAPEPYIEPSTEPSAARAPACAREAPSPTGHAGGGGETVRFFDALGAGWLLTAGQRSRLIPAVAEAVAAGWDPDELARFVGANSVGVRSPFAVLAARLSPAELPPPRTPGPPSRKPWCGHCDPDTRFLLDEHGYPGDLPRRCQQCGPSPARKDPA